MTTIPFKDINSEAERIAKWLNKSEEDFPYEPFITSLLFSSNLSYYEVLGTLEEIKRVYVEVINEKIKEEGK